MATKKKSKQRRQRIGQAEVRQALLCTKKKHGRITPAAVVKDAEPADAILHEAFEWNDTKAGHEYRLYQARQLIRSVQIIIPEQKTAVPAFVHVTHQGKGYYEESRVVVQKPDLFGLAMDELLQKLEAAVRSVKGLRDAAASTVRSAHVNQLIGKVEKSLALASEAAKQLAE